MQMYGDLLSAMYMNQWKDIPSQVQSWKENNRIDGLQWVEIKEFHCCVQWNYFWNICLFIFVDEWAFTELKSKILSRLKREQSSWLKSPLEKSAGTFEQSFSQISIFHLN